VVRLDEEKITPLKEEYTLNLIENLQSTLPEADAVIISDYGKGLLSADLTHRVIHKCRSSKVPLFVDPKGVAWKKYHGATCITPNTAEFNLVLPTLPLQDAGATFDRRADDVLNQFGLEYLLLTRGPQGMSLFKRNAPPFHIATKAKEVFDVSGAGDTVIASLAAAYGTGMKMEQAAEFANTAAGVVIGKVGTRPIEHMELQQIIWDSAIAGLKKIVTRDQALEKIAAWRNSAKTIVFTNGCFDILHIGHIKLLHRAAEQGDKLVVGLNSDASVKMLKGANRPIVPEEERAALLSSIKGVDLVVLFDEETPIELIRQFEPDTLVKGGDYTVETVVGHDIVSQKGGSVVIIPLIEGASTSNIIESAIKRS
jgi:D-beta-D-heptose 7-phosphate kinase/D-beta-D-heptose 1-phosphate adenosyltransferase